MGAGGQKQEGNTESYNKFENKTVDPWLLLVAMASAVPISKQRCLELKTEEHKEFSLELGGETTE